MRILKHLTAGHRKLFWILAVLALVADLATKRWLYRPATAQPQVVRQAEADAPEAVRGLAAADLDADRAPEVVVATDRAVIAYRRTPGKDAQFGTGTPLVTGLSSVRGVCVLDVNADGRPDLLVAGDELCWYENRGDLSFGAGVALPGSPPAEARICAGDMDGDGDQDVLAVGREVAWYENRSNGTFAQHPVFAGQVPLPEQLRATDMDGDGDADVLILAQGTILWYENEGSARLRPGSSLRPGRRLRAFHAADLDGDGDADLLTAAGVIAWHENVGGGTFAAREVVSDQPGGLKSLYTTDLDGDGDVDVLAAADGGVSWYENAPREPIKIIPGLLHLVAHAGNVQGAFGLGPRNPMFFAAAALIGLSIMFVLLWRVPKDRWYMHVALGLLAGGALGNLYDRLARGSVRDFIDLHWQSWHWPTFNIADVAICAGFVIIVLDSFLMAPKEEDAEADAGTMTEDQLR